MRSRFLRFFHYTVNCPCRQRQCAARFRSGFPVVLRDPDAPPAELDPALALHRAEQARKCAAVHAKVPGHLFARHSSADDLACFPGLLPQIRFQPCPTVRDGQEADMALQRPVFPRDLLQQIGQQPYAVRSALLRAAAEQRVQRKNRILVGFAVRSSTGLPTVRADISTSPNRPPASCTAERLSCPSGV